MCLDYSQSTTNFNSSTNQPLATYLEDMEIEEELVENFVNSFTTPLYILPPSHQVYTAPISQYHHYMAICAFSSYHTLSDRSFRHLIQLMGHHLPAENLMETNIDTLKNMCGFDTDFLKHHMYCAVCKKLFTEDIENCRTPGCICKKDKKQYELFCDRQYGGTIERNCRKRWCLENNPRLCKSADRSAYNHI